MSDQSSMFMIDIETTGVDILEDETLEIGLLHLKKSGKYWMPGNHLRIVIPAPVNPVSKFAFEHLAGLYKDCNEAYSYEGPMEPAFVRGSILGFIEGCGAKAGTKLKLCGWNASSFDIPILVREGYLRGPRIRIADDDEDVLVGDFNYNIYDICGATAMLSDATGDEVKDILKAAKIHGDMILSAAGVEYASKGRAHEAVYDCYRQTAILNGLIYTISNMKV